MRKFCISTFSLILTFCLAMLVVLNAGIFSAKVSFADEVNYAIQEGDLVWQKLPETSGDTQNYYWCGAPSDGMLYSSHASWVTHNPGNTYAIGLKFTAPANGTITPDQGNIGLAYRTCDGGDGARLSVFLNEEKIFPKNSLTGQGIPCGETNKITIDVDSAIEVKAGDELYCVIDNGGAGDINCDLAYMFMGFHWTDETHTTSVWYDTVNGGWGTADEGEASYSQELEYKKSQMLSYHYVSVSVLDEKPLERLVEDGSNAKIFSKIAVVGDSLASGELEEHSAAGTFYHDLYDYSWGQFMSRILGNTVYNFSKGGMTAEVYCKTFAEEKGFFDLDKKSDAYIIALGVNDIVNYNQNLGSVSDINLTDYTLNSESFAGYYGQIVQRYKQINPNAFFFFVTMPRNYADPESVMEASVHRDLLYDLAEFFDNSFVIDLFKFAPEYDQEFQKNFFYGGHMSVTGYYYTSKLMNSYIDYIVRKNADLFKDAGYTLISEGLNPTEKTENKTYFKSWDLEFKPLTGVDESNNYWCGAPSDTMAYYSKPEWGPVVNPGSFFSLAMCFTAPADGTISPNNGSIGTVYRKETSGTDGVRLAVMLNDQKIYPAGNALFASVPVGEAGDNNVYYDQPIQMKKGDKLYFVLDNGGNGANDYDATYFVMGFHWTDSTYADLWFDNAGCAWGDETSGQQTYGNTTYAKSDLLSYQYSILTEDGSSDILPKINLDVEAPLTTLIEDGGFASIFRTVSVIGDGFSVGAKTNGMEIVPNYDSSWGKLLSQKIGAELNVMGKIGLTVSDFVNLYGVEQGYFTSTYSSDAYFIALGYEDLINSTTTIGTADDVDASNYQNNADTFAGNMGKLISKIKSLNGSAQIYLITMPKTSADTTDTLTIKTAHSDLLSKIALKFINVSVIDLNTYADFSDTEFTQNNFDGTYFNDGGNAYFAKLILSYTDNLIRKNMSLLTAYKVPETIKPEDIEETGGYMITANPLTWQPLTNLDPNNNYWCGAPSDDTVYITTPEHLQANPGKNYAVGLTFTAPANGAIYPDSKNGVAMIYLTTAQSVDGARVGLYLNQTKLYPSGADTWASVPVGSDNALSIKLNPFNVSKGDKLYLVLDNGGNGNNDYDSCYFALTFRWTDEAHPSAVWYDNRTGGYTDTSSGEALYDGLGYAKNSMLSYDYVTIKKIQEQDPVTTEGKEVRLKVNDFVYTSVGTNEDPSKNDIGWGGIGNIADAYCYVIDGVNIAPGTNYSASVCFTAPCNGRISNALGCGTVYKVNYSDDPDYDSDGTRITVVLNDTVIYPTSGVWQDVPTGKENALQIVFNSMDVKAGDKLYYIIENGGNSHAAYDANVLDASFMWTDATNPNGVLVDFKQEFWTDSKVDGSVKVSFGEYNRSDVFTYHYVEVDECNPVGEAQSVPFQTIDAVTETKLSYNSLTKTWYTVLDTHLWALQDICNPGKIYPLGIQWTAPSDGRIDVSGSFITNYYYHADYDKNGIKSDGVRFGIIVNSTKQVHPWVTINNANKYSIELPIMEVKAGDKVTFMVDMGGACNYDQCNFNVNVAFAKDGENYTQTYNSVKEFNNMVSGTSAFNYVMIKFPEAEDTRVIPPITEVNYSKGGCSSLANLSNVFVMTIVLTAGGILTIAKRRKNNEKDN